VITHFSIEGFKSFGMNARRIRLGPLNFIVGANGSGKSNFINAFSFLKTALTEGLTTAAADKEVRNLRLREGKVPKPVVFDICIRDPEGSGEASVSRVRQISYRLEIDFRADPDIPVVKSERLQASIERAGEPAAVFLAERREAEFRIQNPLAPNGGRDFTQPIGALEQGQLIGASAFLGEPIAVFRRYVERWASYAIHPDAARRPSEASSDFNMACDGERLGATLKEIERKGEHEVIAAIETAIRSFVPGFSGIEPVELPFGRTRWGFKVRESGLSKALSPAGISDGTIRLITMIVIAEWCSRQSGFTTIEEPENSLHPHLTESVVNLFRAASEHGQFLISTHHAGFLDYLKPEELLLCSRDDEGNTVLRHASDDEDVAAFRKKYRLGEMWQMGLFD
jgi:predicted ATPase